MNNDSLFVFVSALPNPFRSTNESGLNLGTVGSTTLHAGSLLGCNLSECGTVALMKLSKEQKSCHRQDSAVPSELYNMDVMYNPVRANPRPVGQVNETVM